MIGPYTPGEGGEVRKEPKTLSRNLEGFLKNDNLFGVVLSLQKKVTILDNRKSTNQNNFLRARVALLEKEKHYFGNDFSFYCFIRLTIVSRIRKKKLELRFRKYLKSNWISKTAQL